jgi:hypothetical protein
MSGFLLCQRDRFAHHLFSSQKFCRGYAWDWMVAQAAFKAHTIDIKGKSVHIDRGQFTASVRFMAKAWGWQKSSVSRFLTRLETESMIGTESGTGQMVVTIRNYSIYQDGSSGGGTGIGTTSGTGAGQERDKIETRVNKGKEKKERLSPSELSPLFGGQEKKRAPAKPKQASVRDRLIEVASPEAVDSYLQFRTGTKAKGTSDRAASLLLKQMVAIRDQGGDVDEALDIAQLQGWQGLNADWYFKIKGQDNGKPNSNNSAGNRRGLAGSTSADEIADRAIRYANDREAKRRTDRDA